MSAIADSGEPEVATEEAPHTDAEGEGVQQLKVSSSQYSNLELVSSQYSNLELISSQY